MTPNTVILLILLCLWLYNITVIYLLISYFQCDVNDKSNYSIYKGQSYWKSGVTLEREILFETENLGLSHHTVQFEQNSEIIEDWMYIDIPKEVYLLYTIQNDTFVVWNSSESYSYYGSSIIAAKYFVKASLFKRRFKIKD